MAYQRDHQREYAARKQQRRDRRQFSVSRRLYERLTAYCQQTGDSRSAVVEAVVETVLDAYGAPPG